MEIFRSELHSDLYGTSKEIMFVKAQSGSGNEIRFLDDVIRCIIWEIEPEYKSKSIVDIIEFDVNADPRYVAERAWTGVLDDTLVVIDGEWDFGKAVKPSSKIQKVLEQFMQKEI